MIFKKYSQNYFFQSLWLLLVAVFFFFIITSFSNAQEQTSSPQETSSLSLSGSLFETPIFNEASQSSTLVSPTFNDDSTNIAFYMKCPSVACPNDGTLESPVYIFSAENLGHGNLPFSDYWAPPFAGDYIAVEYKNDAQQFSCSSITFNQCLADTRFINIFHFTLVNDATIITPEMIDAKDAENHRFPASTTTNSTTSDALLKLSISLSSTSISSNLDNGLIVTASLDGIMSLATSSVFVSNATTAPETKIDTSSSTEASENSSIGSFIIDIVSGVVDGIVEIFTPREATSTEPIQLETIPLDPIESNLPPTLETNINESNSDNDVQSSLSTEVTNENEVTTSTF